MEAQAHTQVDPVQRNLAAGFPIFPGQGKEGSGKPIALEILTKALGRGGYQGLSSLGLGHD